MGIAICCLCIIKSFQNGNAYQVVGSFIYGFSMIILYTMSSVYHGLKNGTAKKVMQVIDHCSIFILIAGTYTPITLTALRIYNPFLGWGVFGFVWAAAVLGIIFNSIDLEKYNLFSNICYIAVGWCIILTGKHAINALTFKGFMWILAGGIAYSLGAVLYVLADKVKVRYFHSVFHIFVVLGSLLQFFGILFYILV